MPRKISLHLSLDYERFTLMAELQKLRGNHKASRTYVEFAQLLGCENPIIMKNDEATKGELMSWFNQQAELSEAGDLIFISFTGHGLSVSEKGTSPEEFDGLEEAICLYDDVLFDDSLFELLCKFKKNVRIILLFDSCYSEGMIRSHLSIQTRAIQSKESFKAMHQRSKMLKARERYDFNKLQSSVLFIYTAAENESAKVHADGTYFSACFNEILDETESSQKFQPLIRALVKNTCGEQKIGMYELGIPFDWGNIPLVSKL